MEEVKRAEDIFDILEESYPYESIMAWLNTEKQKNEEEKKEITQSKESIPDSVKVGNVEYDVNSKDCVEIDGDKNFQGSCDFLGTEISILDSLSDERKKDIFFHELTHAIFYEASYDEHDEEMIDRIGKALHQVVSDNSELLKNL